jgi:hypothetical protein
LELLNTWLRLGAWVVLFCGGPMVWAQSPAPREVQLQSALVLKLLHFVDWPATAKAAHAPLRLCVQATGRVGQALLMTANPTWRHEPIRVVSLAKVDDEWMDCHVLVLEQAKAGALPPRQMGLLTIGFAEGFVQRGGMISIVQRNNRFSFDVNLDVTKQAQLRLETTLVQLAHTVVHAK